MVLTLSTDFVVFLAVLGPPKVLLAYARLIHNRTPRQTHRLIVFSSLLAALVGLTLDYTATLITDFFHVGTTALILSGGVVFFLYAVLQVLGIHLNGEGSEQADELAPGLRQLLLPYAASPLAVTAVLIISLSDPTWHGRSITALSYLAVVAINAVCAYLLAPVMRRTTNPGLGLELLLRLLGLLLAAVGVELVLEGLKAAGVPLIAGTA